MAHYAVTIQRPVTVYDGEINDVIVSTIVTLYDLDRIAAIKLVRYLGLYEAKCVIEAIIERHGRR